jgi:alkaline phosphatase
MTSKAIDLLAKNRKGYFLMVEGGRIDHAHHDNNAYRALTETIEFANAVKAALAKINLRETLVVESGHPLPDSSCVGAQGLSAL